MAKKVNWNNGDIFAVNLKDGNYSVGQILDLQMKNVVRCAFFKEKYNSIDSIPITNIHKENSLISLVATTKEQLDYNVWSIIGITEIRVPLEKYPNEKYRDNGWIGSKVYDAAIVEEFLDAFFGLAFWDDWANPNYLNGLLINESIRPKNLKFKSL